MCVCICCLTWSYCCMPISAHHLTVKIISRELLEERLLGPAPRNIYSRTAWKLCMKELNLIPPEAVSSNMLLFSLCGLSLLSGVTSVGLSSCEHVIWVSIWGVPQVWGRVSIASSICPCSNRIRQTCWLGSRSSQGSGQWFSWSPSQFWWLVSLFGLLFWRTNWISHQCKWINLGWRRFHWV